MSNELVEKVIADKNGRVTTVRVKPDSGIGSDRMTPTASVLSSIDGWPANTWMRMIRDAEADKYDKLWKADDDDLKARGWLVSVGEIGFGVVDHETKARAESWLSSPESYLGAKKTVDPSSISFVTSGKNLRLDVLSYYLNDESGTTFSEDGTADDNGVIMMRIGDGTHYIVDGKHRTAAAIIKNETLDAHVVDLPK